MFSGKALSSLLLGSSLSLRLRGVFVSEFSVRADGNVDSKVFSPESRGRESIKLGASSHVLSKSVEVSKEPEVSSDIPSCCGISSCKDTEGCTSPLASGVGSVVGSEKSKRKSLERSKSEEEVSAGSDTGVSSSIGAVSLGREESSIVSDVGFSVISGGEISSTGREEGNSGEGISSDISKETSGTDSTFSEGKSRVKSASSACSSVLAGVSSNANSSDTGSSAFCETSSSPKPRSKSVFVVF